MSDIMKLKLIEKGINVLAIRRLTVDFTDKEGYRISANNTRTYWKLWLEYMSDTMHPTEKLWASLYIKRVQRNTVLSYYEPWRKPIANKTLYTDFWNLDFFVPLENSQDWMGYLVHNSYMKDLVGRRSP